MLFIGLMFAQYSGLLWTLPIAILLSVKHIVATSDLHGHLPDIPKCDLLLIAGDVCPVDQSHEVYVQRNWLRSDFDVWLDIQQDHCGDIVWIAGNHDFACEQPGFRRIADTLHAHYLQDEAIEVQGLKIWGSPWVPNLPSWAFYSEHDNFKDRAAAIPDDTDIVMLHGPPHDILDGIPIAFTTAKNHVGAPYIASRLQEISPKLVIFGHIHEGYGTKMIDHVEYANVAHMNATYLPINKPIEFWL